MKKVFPILLATLLTFGLISFGGCNGSKNELGIREEDAKEMVEMESTLINTMAVSYTLHNPITLTGEDESEFVCTSLQDAGNEGGFHLKDASKDTSSITVASGTTIYWSSGFPGKLGTSKEVFWFEFINRKESHILGYAVVKVERITDFYYVPTIVKSVTFPKTLGIFYQNVTEEQVGQLIKNAEK